MRSSTRRCSAPWPSPSGWQAGLESLPQSSPGGRSPRTRSPRRGCLQLRLARRLRALGSVAHRGHRHRRRRDRDAPRAGEGGQGGRERGAIAPARRAPAGACRVPLGCADGRGGGRRHGRGRPRCDRRPGWSARARRGAGARHRRSARGTRADAPTRSPLPALGSRTDHDGGTRGQAGVGAAARRVRLEVPRRRGAGALCLGRTGGSDLRRRAPGGSDGISVPGRRRDHGRGTSPCTHLGRSRRSGTRAGRSLRARAELTRVTRPRPRRGAALPTGSHARGGRRVDLRRGPSRLRLRRRADLDTGR